MGIKVALVDNMNIDAFLQRHSEECATLKAYARGVAGGLLFGTPLIFTMEMWWLGFYLSPERLLIALIANFCILLILERYSGFRSDETFLDQVQDAVVAQGLGLTVSVVILSVLNLLRPEMSMREMSGKVIMQTMAVSIGVSVAITQLGQQSNGESERKQRRIMQADFWGIQAIALAGAVFFGLNVAATEEPVMIGLQMRPGQTLMLLVLSLMLVFAITFALDFRGEASIHEGAHWYNAFVRDSVVTWATATVCAGALLWLFGSIDSSTSLTAILQITTCLGFVTSLGAAAARLLI